MLRSSDTASEAPADQEIVGRDSGQSVGVEARIGQYRPLGAQLLRRRADRVRRDAAGGRDPDTELLQTRSNRGDRRETKIRRKYAPKSGRDSRDCCAQKNYRVPGYTTYSGIASHEEKREKLQLKNLTTRFLFMVAFSKKQSCRFADTNPKTRYNGLNG